EPEKVFRTQARHGSGEPVGQAARAGVTKECRALLIGRERRGGKRQPCPWRGCDAGPTGGPSGGLQQARLIRGFESFGSIFGFISIWLTVRASVWCWPTGIVNIVLLLVTYVEARLYGDVLNYLVMLALSIWGWIAWVRPSRTRGKARIRYASKRVRWLAFIGVVAGAPPLGGVFVRCTQSAAPRGGSPGNTMALVGPAPLL